MNICIQNYEMAEYVIPENKPLTIRLDDAQHIRFWKLMERANSRAYANKSNLLRELLGLSELKVLSEADVEYFKTGKKQPEVKKVSTETVRTIQPNKKNKKETKIA